MTTFEENSLNEIIQVVKTSSDSSAFIALLRKVLEQVSDVRIEINEIEDSINLRQGLIKVINDMLIRPLEKERPTKETSQSIDYR